jgi:Ca-activated chloride channel family protein
MRFTKLVLMVCLVALISACGDGPLTGANSVNISIVYGSEKRAWMEAVVTTFNNQRAKTPDGKTIVVTATPMGSNDSLNRILNGEIQPTIWSPASTILVPVANDAWAQQNSGARLVDDNPPPLVLSPVVIAMWEPMARVIGWPDKPIGWGDIAEIARSGKSWGDFGHPEWGAFQFGHTHPDFSNSGVTSIIAMAYAATGKTRDLQVSDVQKPETASFVQAVQSSIIHYGESTGFFGTQMFSRGPGYLSAAILYENLIIESRDQSRYPNLSLPVVAIYPKEGTFWSDHPYAVLNAPWVTADQQAAAGVFREFLLARPQQEQALQFGFRPADPGIAIGAPITPANGVDPTQPQTLLEVPSVNTFQAIRTLWQQNKKRVELEIVLDVSGSMRDEDRLEQAKKALQTFVANLADEDQVALTIFSNSVTPLYPMTSVGTIRQDLINRIGGLVPQGNTRLLDTVAEAHQRLTAEPPGRAIRAVVVLTDGLDNRSTQDANQLLSTLRQDEEGRSVKVFTIAFGGDADTELLKQIAEASGAKSYIGNPNEPGNIEQVYRDIATFF